MEDVVRQLSSYLDRREKRGTGDDGQTVDLSAVFERERLPIVLVIIVIFGSIAGLFVTISDTTTVFLKQSVLNVVFVKMGWFWTMVPIGLLATSQVLKGKRLPVSTIIHLVLSTACWYFFTTAFNVLQYYSGSCTDSVFLSIRSCFKGGAEWTGFDISGHVFIMVLSSMCLFEEAPQIRKLVIEQDLPVALSCGPTQLIDYALLALFTFIRLVWLIMLCSTSLFFHSMPSKLLALLFAFGCYTLVYHVIPMDRHAKFV